MNENNIYIVMRFYISASDNNSNGYSNCEIFSNKKKARQLFRKWRNEELEARRETGCAFEVNTDTEQMFHCLWDSGLEMLFVKWEKKTVSPGLHTIIEKTYQTENLAQLH